MERLDDAEYQWEVTYTMLQCCGCESVTMRLTTWFELTDDHDEEFFPPPISRRFPTWEPALDREYRQLLREVYTALHSRCYRLVAMGARALVDVFANKNVGDVGNFMNKLETLEREGYIGAHDRGILAAALEVGHAASHRGHAPPDSTVEAVMDVVEHLLQKEVLAKRSELLRRTTPVRPPRPKPPSSA
jgi:hypothetical protein